MRFLIVDDDSLVRIALKTMLNWESHGFELVGEAGNGMEALALIERHHPDIVILDVRMPVLDGVGVLRELAGQTVKPRVIIVSSHGDFELVKEAMKLGAEDYLLKLDISFDNLLAVMERVAEKILAERRENEETERKERHLHRHLAAMRKEFYRNVVGRLTFSDKDLEESIRFLQLPVDRANHVCFLVKVEGDTGWNASRDQVQIGNFAIINVVEEILGETFHCTCFEWSQGEFYAVSTPGEDADYGRDALRALGERLVEILRVYLNIDVCICIGMGGPGIAGIRRAGESAEQVLLKRYLKGSELVLLWEEPAADASGAVGFGKGAGIGRSMDGANIGLSGESDYSILSVKESLMTALVTHSETEIDAVLGGIIRDMSRFTMSRDQIRTAMMFLYAMICEYFEQSGVEAGSVLRESISGYDELMGITTPMAATGLMERLRRDLMRFARESAGNVGDSLQRARHFIQKRYAEEISLQDVAEAVSMNPSYLSHLLKKKTGMNYTEYLIHLRIRKARELMRNTDDKVYEISEQVGYPNTFYFTRLFKRETGCSPSEYRRRVRGEGDGVQSPEA